MATMKVKPLTKEQIRKDTLDSTLIEITDPKRREQFIRGTRERWAREDAEDARRQQLR
jgi:hypothetical protein